MSWCVSLGSCGRRVKKKKSSPPVLLSQVVLVVKNPPARAGDVRDVDSVPGSGRSPGGGDDNLLQSSCLENPVDRGAWWATVHGVTKSWIQLTE